MDLSIIIPVFNSENILEQLIHRIVKSLNNLQIKFEIILINDFSHDASWKKIKFLSKGVVGSRKCSLDCSSIGLCTSPFNLKVR